VLRPCGCWLALTEVLRELVRQEQSGGAGPFRDSYDELSTFAVPPARPSQRDRLQLVGLRSATMRPADAANP